MTAKLQLFKFFHILSEKKNRGKKLKEIRKKMKRIIAEKKNFFLIFTLFSFTVQQKKNNWTLIC